jgi:arginine/lysine/ornithine decarboxylase
MTPLKTPLLDAVAHYPTLKRLPFHVPGHGGNAHTLPPALQDAFVTLGLNAALRHDLTELDGLDVLATPDAPDGVIHQSQALTAQRWGVRQSFYLVNGSSVGLHAALLAILPPKGKILVPRNAHRAVLAGLILCDAQPVWCLPQWEATYGCWGGLTLETLQAHHQRHPDLTAVLVTSPTYEGIVSPIESLSDYCQQHGLYLIVDEAHGAHLALSTVLPVSACHSHADAVIQSVHKTLGSLTQTALLHLPQGSKVSAERMQQVLGHLQTTSPSYLLLSSIDAVSAFWWSEAGQAHIASQLAALKEFRSALATLLPSKGFHLLSHPQADPFRLYIRHSLGLSSEAWAVELEDTHGLSFERLNLDGALYLAQPLHSPTLWHTFIKRWQNLPSMTGATTPQPTLTPISAPRVALPEQVMTPREAFYLPSQSCPVGEAVGRMSAETIVACPPGIPILLTGERISASVVAQLQQSTVQVVLGV